MRLLKVKVHSVCKTKLKVKTQLSHTRDMKLVEVAQKIMGISSVVIWGGHCYLGGHYAGYNRTHTVMTLLILL